MNVGLSIGQRLGLGFGLVLVILGAMVASTFYFQGQSAVAQAEYIDDVLPRAQLTEAVERGVLQAGIEIRNYLLAPTPARLQESRRLVASVAEAAQRLGRLPHDPDGARLVREVELHVRAWERRTEQVLSREAALPVSPAEEAALSAAREAALVALRRFAEHDAGKASAALGRLAASRQSVQRGLLVSSGLTLVALIVLAIATTQSIRRPTRRLLGLAAALESGERRAVMAAADDPGSPGTATRNEMLTLARAFASAAWAIERREARLSAEGQVAMASASSLEATRLSAEALRAVVEYVEAAVGVIYAVAPGSRLLHPVARHALDEAAGGVRIGDGVPGQAAREGRTVFVREVPADTPFLVNLGFGKTPPRSVAAVPIAFRGEVLGVLLVGSLRELDAEAISFLERAALQLGIGLRNVATYEEGQRLLAALREKTDEVQAQNEELQAQNEEIQAQHEELQAQNEELHAQQLQLVRYGEDLHSHAEQLAQADARKNDFLGVLAHELRNPMAPITTSLYIVKRAAPGSEQAARAQAVIERQVRHMTRLIDDLLDVTRISRGKIQIQRERIDLTEVARACLDDQRAMLDGRGVSLDTQVPADPVWVEGDYTRLCQVVSNILTNAIKFTGPGDRVTLRVSANQAAGEAAIHVVDSGIGIRPELLPHLFEPFSQGPSSLARTSGGLGLGLALVKALVELHEGTVEARSDGEGHGAEFIVRLPLGEPPADVPHARHVNGRAWRILIVEDNLDAAESLREALELQGHQMEVAYSGSQALEKALAFRPGIVLCDVGLPDLDGYEVARRVRNDARLRGTRLVALTGYASAQDRIRAAEAGFDRHLAKPPSVERLAEVLAEFERTDGVVSA
jgi:signal transduction histidine kinase/ActR/RegA family two-component response regulator/CHASE3 domain sensor protein